MPLEDLRGQLCLVESDLCRVKQIMAAGLRGQLCLVKSDLCRVKQIMAAGLRGQLCLEGSDICRIEVYCLDLLGGIFHG